MLVTDGLWYSVFGPRAVRVVIVRESADTTGYEIALISTDVDAGPAPIVARYADRWSIEVCFQDAKHTIGVGQARNRVKLAVERTVPFGMLCQSITIAWYALHGDPVGDVRARRLRAPWYPHKRAPSMLDIQASLRRELIRSEYHAQAGRRPIPAQTARRSLPPIAATGWITKVEFSRIFGRNRRFDGLDSSTL